MLSSRLVYWVAVLPDVFAFPVLEPATKFEQPAEIREMARATPQLWRNAPDRYTMSVTHDKKRGLDVQYDDHVIFVIYLFIQSSSGSLLAERKAPASIQ